MNSDIGGWFKSSYSQGDGSDCVEVATTACVVHIRDSKHNGGPRLAIPPAAWAEFIAGVAEQP
ncbi:DUF397 domain-containing protein [Streptomyces sp. NPDC052396]|uniref:DUF397 domain-containing protein n=1 Tax=Streptomyces sp. NPDC052396 TaxID=3365689 RepID=UPI0037D67F6D